MSNAATHKLLRGLPSERLNPEQEQLLARNLVRPDKEVSGNVKQAARNLLVIHAMWESFFYARRCCRMKLPDDEIYSLSYDALCRAVSNFRPGKIRFFAYAKVYVRGAICKAWKQKDVVKNSSSHESLMIEDVWSTLQHGEERVDMEDGRYGFCASTLTDWQQKFREKKLFPDCEDPDFSTVHTHEIWSILEPFLKGLSSREREVITMMYKQGLNLREIGDQLKVRRQAIDITHQRALKKLRCVLSHKKGLLLGHD